MMKKYYSLVTILFALLVMSFMAGDDTMTKEDGMFVVNTTTIGKDVEGYTSLPH